MTSLHGSRRHAYELLGHEQSFGQGVERAYKSLWVPEFWNLKGSVSTLGTAPAMRRIAS